MKTILIISAHQTIFEGGIHEIQKLVPPIVVQGSKISIRKHDTILINKDKYMLAMSMSPQKSIESIIQAVKKTCILSYLEILMGGD